MKLFSTLPLAGLLVALAQPGVSGTATFSLRASASSSADDYDDEETRRLQTLPPADIEILTLAAAIPTLDLYLGQYETPIALRLTNYFGAIWWNCIAVYSPDFTDTLTKTDPVVRVTDSAKHTKTNRVTCMAQAAATYNSLSLPEAQEGYLSVIYGNNPFPPGAVNYTGVVDLDPVLTGEVAICRYANGTIDAACLDLVAASESYSPRVMGMIVAYLGYWYSLEDGYNQLGKDDGCTVSCRPYKDTTGYAPVNSPWNTKGNKPENRWEPLLEDNGKGFFYRHEHVTPHIGQKAKFRYIPESDRSSRVASSPCYSKRRISEALMVIGLMATLDDYKKVEVEIFDDKLVVGNAIVNSFIGKLATEQFVDTEFPPTDPNNVVSLERFVNFVSGYVAMELDAAIIAWKEKVHFDLVRPTTIIKLFGGNITTWAPGGVQEFNSEYFEAYKRVMPHSEYVSGSACLFQGVEDYITKYMENLNLPTTFPVGFDPFLAGTSSVEPGVVPATDITLTYPNITAMASAGSQSRLNGGMHFEASVPAAKTLCAGIGTHAAEGTFGLYQSSASG